MHLYLSFVMLVEHQNMCYVLVLVVGHTEYTERGGGGCEQCGALFPKTSLL
jgi:hypothetical protein